MTRTYSTSHSCGPVQDDRANRLKSEMLRGGGVHARVGVRGWRGETVEG